jgi:simple sugar transport system substrate-binding protein
MATYSGRFYEARYVCGIIAARMSKTGVVGYVGSFPIPEVVMGINAFILGARTVNPNFKAKVIWVSSWYDPAKEADAAKVLLDQGCDVIAQHTDSPAALQAAQARGMYAFGQDSDMTSVAPKAHLTAIVNNWGAYYKIRVGQVLDGTWKTGDSWWGFDKDMIRLAPYNPVIPPNVVAEADAAKAAIISGKLKIFTGPLKDNKGAEQVASGKVLTDGELSNMKWYIDGVQA